MQVVAAVALGLQGAGLGRVAGGGGKVHHAIRLVSGADPLVDRGAQGLTVGRIGAPAEDGGEGGQIGLHAVAVRRVDVGAQTVNQLLGRGQVSHGAGGMYAVRVDDIVDAVQNQHAVRTGNVDLALKAGHAAGAVVAVL